MKNAGDNEKYQIKVNRVSTENEKLFPYSKFLKNNYSQLSKIAPKNSILYKLKINPEIIINEYHQTSNNINTNISIKTNQSQDNKKNNKNNENLNINNISFSGQANNISFSNCDNDNPIKEEITDNTNSNNKTNTYGTNIQKNEYDSTKLNISENRIRHKKNNSDLLSPFSYKYNTSNGMSDNKRKINCIKDIKYCNLVKNRDLKDCNYFFQNPLIDTRNIKKIKYSITDRYNYNTQIINNYIDNENNNINNKYLYAKYNPNLNEQNKDYSLDIFNTSNVLNDNRDNRENSPSINIYNIIEKPNDLRGDTSMESLRVKKMKEMNDILLSSGNRYTHIFRNTHNKNNNYISNNNQDNSKETLNIKLDNYRTKLFKEFMKYFMYFIHKYIKRTFNLFVKKFRIYRPKKETRYIYSRKSFFNNTIDNVKQKQINLIKRINRNELNLFDIFKSSTNKDNYELYNKSNNINPDVKQMFNSFSLNKEINEYKKTHLLNRSLTSFFKNKSFINSAPRIFKKYVNNYSLKRNLRKKGKHMNSKSPSFHFGNTTIINNDISFRNEGNKKENELFRDSKELDKKFEQIQRRKKKSQNKSANKNQNIQKNLNKSADVHKIKNSDEYNEFNELRKNLRKSKKDNSKNQYTINVSSHLKDKPKKKHLAKVKSYDDNVYNSNDNNNDDINQKSNNYKTINNKNYESKQKIKCYKYKVLYCKSNNKDTQNIIDKKDRYETNYKNKEGTPVVQKNKNDISQTKNKSSNKKTVKKQNNYKSNTNKSNKSKDSSYKHVKVNKNNKIVNQPKEQMKKQNNYNVIKQVPKATNQITKKNIYYNKKNNIKDINISIIIKNIVTKDKRIYLNIKYYKYWTKKNYSKKNFNSLKISDNISICLLGDESQSDLKTQYRLDPIKEEETSIQTSKFYDETATFGVNNNIYDNRRNNTIRFQMALIYKQFIDTIEHLLKKLFIKKLIDKIKPINSKDNKKNESYNKNKDINSSKLYIKKGVINNKVIGDAKNNVINNNKKIEKKYEKKIKKFRMHLIGYILGYSG